MAVTLHTTHGDLKLEIFCEAVPKTAENFLALCASGAYNNTPFHRLIPSFMIQGGDISLSDSAIASGTSYSLPFTIPKGGASIYHPEPLEQEIHLPALRHNSRGILSMAGKSIRKPTISSASGSSATTQEVNGSQFFVIFAPAPHLDGKSTVFGKVLNLGVPDDGQTNDTLTRLENAKVKTDKKGRVVQPETRGTADETGSHDYAEEEFDRIGIKSVTLHANPFAG